MTDAGPDSWSVTPVGPSDRDGWESLHDAYATGAGRPLPPQQLDLVWSWLLRDDAQTHGLLLRRTGGPVPVGLLHYRAFERPLHGSIGCYMDDLYVDPQARGRGGALALIEHLADLAASHGWTTVRWTTGDTNPAQRLYDRIATRNAVITFDLPVAPPDPTPAP